MPAPSKALALAVAISGVSAFRGFNYGNKFTTGALKQQADYEAEFKAARELPGTNGAFDSARLYTMIQGETGTDPNAAIPAAIKTKTSLLFGLWASAGDEAFNNELAALHKTVDQYCGQLDGLVAGISVGSEDLYRNSPTGIENGEWAGANPGTLAGYIGRVREAIKGTCLSSAPIGHVDTWTAYANGSNSALIEACDWLGMDAYAYFESTQPNAIRNGKKLFDAALGATKAAGHGKPVWITETGWPVSGKNFGEAIASAENARTFYKEVGCPEFGSTNVWWYTLLDAAPDTPNPSFGVINELGGKPLYDLSCDGETTKRGAAIPSDTEIANPVPTQSTLPTLSNDEPLPTDSVPADEPQPSNQPTQPTPPGPVPIPHPTDSPAPIPGNPEPSGQPGNEPSEPTTPGQSTPGSSPTEAPAPAPTAAAARLNSLGAAAVAFIPLAMGVL
ncbi:hypothetical protein N3K66_003384 [Trichothecium roseum]|uniref:Uncharacterized protein n=1 Tax=Trichothecium roseum TaxID=47278 RepID=A0ACC0V7W0_9HYPO|nr:hypothetical protein N3K66_003384 [Trichothecium roseum]